MSDILLPEKKCRRDPGIVPCKEVSAKVERRGTATVVPPRRERDALGGPQQAPLAI